MKAIKIFMRLLVTFGSKLEINIGVSEAVPSIMAKSWAAKQQIKRNPRKQVRIIYQQKTYQFIFLLVPMPYILKNLSNKPFQKYMTFYRTFSETYSESWHAFKME